MTVSAARYNLPNQEFFTPVELADLLGVHKRTIVVWIKDPNKKLNGVKLSNNLWRVSRESLVEFLEDLYGQQR